MRYRRKNIFLNRAGVFAPAFMAWEHFIAKFAFLIIGVLNFEFCIALITKVSVAGQYVFIF